ncbi:MAG: DUF5665 domain-containing protein [Rhodobacteraceae bacterium]|nr:DUF5665 domain-containing protein [Paracoccaceae bacterium]
MTQDIDALTKELRNLQEHYAMRSLSSKRRMMLAQFLRGIAFGLGSVLGATVVVSALVYSLSQIDFIPILGDWANEIIQIIEPPTGE